MLNNDISTIFGTKTSIKLLSAMYSYSGALSGRALAKLAGINHQACSNEIKKLVSIGIIRTIGSGRTGIYELNRNNILVEEMLKPVFELKSNIYKKLGEDICGLKVGGIKSILLFGSAARRDEKQGSDIDVMIVVETKAQKEQAEDALSKSNLFFFQRYGNSLAPYVITVGEFRDRYKTKNSLIMNVISQGQVLYGKQAGEILNDKKES